MKYYEKLRSEKNNISLCSISLLDSELYMDWKNNDSEENKIIFESYKDGKLENVESAREELNKMAVDNAFAIIYNNKMIGLIGYSNTIMSNQRSNIWLKLDPELDMDLQINLGVEALDTLIKYSYETMNLNSLIIETPAFNKQVLEILKNSNMTYLGERTNSILYQNNEYYNSVYYQTTKELYNKENKHNESIDSKGTNIIIPDGLKMKEFIKGNGITLKKCDEVKSDYVPIMANFLNNPSLSIPVGEYKTNWNDYRSTKQISGVDYLILENEKLIGYVNLFRKNMRNHTADLEILISNEMQGKGYGKEALLLLLKEAFVNGGYINILSSVFSFNDKSQNLHENIGYKKIGSRLEAYYAYGKLNDMNLYEMTNDSYSKKYVK